MIHRPLAKMRVRLNLNRHCEGAETQGMMVAGGGRFLTGAVRITRKFRCVTTLEQALSNRGVQSSVSSVSCSIPTATFGLIML